MDFGKTVSVGWLGSLAENQSQFAAHVFHDDLRDGADFFFEESAIDRTNLVDQYFRFQIVSGGANWK